MKIKGEKGEGERVSSILFSRSIESPVGALQFQCQSADLLPGDRYELSCDGKVLSWGIIDEIAQHQSPDDRYLNFCGRDLTSLIVDSAYTGKSDEFQGLQSFPDIAASLCAPFGIAVVADVPSAKIESLKINPGDTVFEILEKASRNLGVLLTTTDGKTLLITKTQGSESVAKFDRHSPVISLDLTHSLHSRYARYIVKSQTFDSFDSVSGEAVDEEVKDKSLIILAETNLNPEQARKRAEWERDIRKARGFELTLKLQGIHSLTSGKLVRISLGSVSGNFLIKAFSLQNDSEEGSTTTLNLCLTGAYNPSPVVEHTERYKEIFGLR